jgi:hypothetical protein
MTNVLKKLHKQSQIWDNVLWTQFLGKINFVNVEFKPKITYINIIN